MKNDYSTSFIFKVDLKFYNNIKYIRYEYHFACVNCMEGGGWMNNLNYLTLYNINKRKEGQRNVWRLYGD